MASIIKSVFVAGHSGMVGSAIMRLLKPRDDIALIFRSRSQLNLLNQQEVHDFFKNHAIDEVYLAAARVGGIHANNTYPADFIYENLTIQNNIINAAHESGVQSLLFLGSSCIYPKFAKQPMKETELLQGLLEPTNEPYAIAKIAGIKLCESYRRQYGRDYRSVMPTNLYGPGDNFHPENSHVIPGMLQRFYEAARAGEKEVSIWGTGQSRREFLHVDDMASACLHVMELPKQDYMAVTEERLTHLNVGTGTDCSIAELAQLIKFTTGFQGELIFDTSKPDGAPKKLLDVTRIQKTGWSYKTSLEDGLKQTWNWYLNNKVLI